MLGWGRGGVSTASGAGDGGAFPVTGSDGNGRRFGIVRGPAAAGAEADSGSAPWGLAFTAGFSGLGRVS